MTANRNKENGEMDISSLRSRNLFRCALLCLLCLLPLLSLSGCKKEEEGANDPNYYKGDFKRPGGSEGGPAKGKGDS
jgi:hypothetical protein